MTYTAGSEPRHARIAGSRGSLVLLACAAAIAVAAAACGSGSDGEPAPDAPEAPAATATPTPTAPPPSPSAGLDELRITPATTGGELVAAISEAEARCFSAAMGDVNFQLFHGTPLLAAIAAAPAYELFAACLESDALLSLGVALISARLGGLSDGSLACVSDLSRGHPELVYLTLGVAGEMADRSHPRETHSILLEMYDCLSVAEQAAFSAIANTTVPEVAPFTGQHFLDALAESEVECLRTSLPPGVFDLIAAAPSVAGGELQGAPPELLSCISPESLARLPGEVMAVGMGAESDESRACIVEFAAEHSHYVELGRLAASDPDALTPEQYVELAEDGFALFSCLTDEELAEYQTRYLPALVP